MVGAIRWLRASILVVAATSLAMPAQAARAAGGSVSVHLPTDADAIAYAPFSQPLLFGQAGIETRLPGPVSDSESILVGLDTDGSVASVRVDQRLALKGLGDFEFRVPGPARTVQALPGSANQPGLRKGAVLWQGFSSGQKLLAATMQLFPDQESHRLPLAFTLSMTAGGRPLRPGVPLSGPMRVVLRIANVSAIPIRITGSPADPRTLAPVLDRVYGDLRHGRKPEPGKDGLPSAVQASGPATERSLDIECPFHVQGELVFPPGSVSGLEAQGGTASTQSDGTHVSFAALLDGETAEHRVALSAMARRLTLPALRIDAHTALPPPSAVRPPEGSSWSAGVARDPGRFDGGDMLSRLEVALWRGARTAQYDQYLGNPDPTGPSDSDYRIVLAPPRRAAPAVVATPRGVSAPGLAALAAMAGVALFGAALVWARS